MEYSNASIDNTNLEFTRTGSGLMPVVFIQGGIIADANIPLITQQILSKRFQLFHYHRRGYADSTHVPDECNVSISKQADDCYELIRRYSGINDGAHILGLL